MGMHWMQPNATDAPTTPRAPVASVMTYPGVAALPVESLSQAEIDGLMRMREEEKMARDVYTTLYGEWQVPVFANIAQAEQTHFDAVGALFTKYDLTDPVTDDTVGVLTNPTLAQMYTDLTAEGKTSLVAALTAGAKIEDTDINDLQDLIAATDNADIKLVYESLLRGSRNHLRAFVSLLAAQGVTYTPVALSQSTYDAIIANGREIGPTDGALGADMMQQNGARPQRGWGNR